MSTIPEGASFVGKPKASGGLSIRDLTLSIGRGSSAKNILRGISLDVPSGQITGLAGESGSGKTMTGMTVLGLQPAQAKVTGTIEFDGRNLLELPTKKLNTLRGNDIAMVFQDPTSSLHPMLSIGSQLTDHLRQHTGMSKREALERARVVLEQVKVPDPAGALKKYPHQFSGGQLQRVAIASAIMCSPSVLIADEPTTALDVTVQAGILRLLRELCDELGLAILLVTHDLGVMSALADTIAVMRQGEIVEHGDRFQVITAPRDPYTKALIDALPHDGSAGSAPDSASTGDAS
ncbi:peptide/nickel transport system ATP-binding protein [Agreia bicolorata]|uniref:Peptide/nickel transport system ATP-binding protein n=1 Tax=Agreia bicolorata TaxID=110935 RepID=A0A1T4Y906_9MICO|nr:ABC transporter ATP-binding protein [Agreia bicolorata]SKA98334.1 peptide/nickel transport system ATP-binding protein [Agreia bicolorata]